MSSPSGDLLRAAKAHVLVDDVGRPVLTGDTEHHLRRVLRLKDGATVTVTDGRGSWGRTHLTPVGLAASDEVGFRERPGRPVTIGFAIPKQDRPEWIVQKLTELGVARVILLHADRSVVRWSPDKANAKLERLRSVSIEALQQSRGVWLPEIAGPIEAGAALGDSAVAEPGGGAFPQAQTSYLVGPEGGWSPDELARSGSTFDLGETILRVETAAIAVACRALNVIG